MKHIKHWAARLKSGIILFSLLLCTVIVLTGCGQSGGGGDSGGGNNTNPSNPPAWNGDNSLKPDANSGQSYHSNDLTTYLSNAPQGVIFSPGVPTDGWLTIQGNQVVSTSNAPANITSAVVTVVATNPSTNESAQQTFTVNVVSNHNPVQPQWTANDSQLPPATASSGSYASDPLKDYLSNLSQVGDGNNLSFIVDTSVAHANWLDVQPVKNNQGQAEYEVVLTGATIPASGQGTIGVIAVNDGMKSASQTFTVTINSSGVTKIPGWPDYLAMGTVTNNYNSVRNELIQHPVDATFKYACAGTNNNGDCNDTDITNDLNTIKRSIVEAGQIQNGYTDSNGQFHAGNNHKVVPTLVIYTAYASGANGLNDALADVTGQLEIHYQDLIQFCQYINTSYKTNNVSIILNPDLFGRMEQDQSLGILTPTTTVQVASQLKAAFLALNLDTSVIPTAFADSSRQNMQGYIQSINWIIRYFSPTVSFGWQENLWATGGSSWIHTPPTQLDVTTITDPINQYLATLGAYQTGNCQQDGVCKPDFIVFDRYEEDDLWLNPAIYFYNRSDWTNYLSFVKNISDSLNMPAMIWQIPGGHLLTNTGASNTKDLSIQHVSTAPDFFFGDTDIADNSGNPIGNMTAAVLTHALDTAQYPQSPTADNTVNTHLQRDTDQDWTQSELEAAVNHNVVAILWGGGDNTVGVAPLTRDDSDNAAPDPTTGTNGFDDYWLAGKVSDYFSHTTPLNSFDSH